MKQKTTAEDLKQLCMILPNSVRALVRGVKSWDPSDKFVLDDEDVYLPVLYSISSVLVFKAMIPQLSKNATVKAMIRIKDGDTTKAVKTLGIIQALGALLEFLIGPLCGKLSDVYGRKAIMRLNPIVSMAYQTLLWLKPHCLWVHYLKIVTIAMDTAFFSTMHAMMADVMSGPNRAQNGFINMFPVGVAQMAAPFIAARLSSRNNFFLATLLSFASVGVVGRLQETLSPKARQSPSSIQLASCNPFAFYRLFTHGRALATLSLVSGVQTYSDPRLMDDTAIVVMKEKLGWNDQQIQSQLGAMSMSLVLGVGVGKFSVKSLGRLGHTHFSHIMKLLTYIACSRVTSVKAMRWTQALMVFGQRQRDGTDTLISDIGTKAGMGKGQVEAWKFNFRSVSNLVAPVVYAQLFGYGKSIGNPALPWAGAAGFVALAELILCSLPRHTLDAVLADVSRKSSK